MAAGREHGAFTALGHDQLQRHGSGTILPVMPSVIPIIDSGASAKQIVLAASGILVLMQF